MSVQVKTGVQTALAILGILVGVWLVYQLLPIVILLLITLVFTTGIDPIVTRLQRFTRRRVPRSVITLLVMLLGLVILSIAVTVLVTTAVEETTNFITNTWPKQETRLQYWVAQQVKQYNLDQVTPDLLKNLQGQSGQIAGYFMSTTKAVFGFLGGLFSVFLLLILTFFFTTYRKGIVRNLSRLLPPHCRVSALRILRHAAARMGGWLRGQLMLALIIMVANFLFMAVIGMPYAGIIAIIGGIGELIPMVGPYLAFWPALFIALATGQPLWVLIAIFVFSAVLAQVENYLLAPKIMERQVGLHPVTTIIAAICGATLLGAVGALLAIPVSAGLRVIMLEAVYPAIAGRFPVCAPPTTGSPVPVQEVSPAPAKRKRKKTAEV